MEDFKIVNTTVAGSLTYPVLGNSWSATATPVVDGALLAITNVTVLSSFCSQVNKTVSYNLRLRMSTAGGQATGRVTVTPPATISTTSLVGTLTPTAIAHVGIFGAATTANDLIIINIFNATGNEVNVVNGIFQVAGSFFTE